MLHSLPKGWTLLSQFKLRGIRRGPIREGALLHKIQYLRIQSRTAIPFGHYNMNESDMLMYPLQLYKDPSQA